MDENSQGRPVKIAVPASGRTLDARVENKMGAAPYVLIIDPNDMSFEILARSPHSLGSGAGIETVSRALDKGATVILVGYMSPTVSSPLEKAGITVVISVGGSVHDAVLSYMRGKFTPTETRESDPKPAVSARQIRDWRTVLRKTVKQFTAILPVLCGVILLAGLFKAMLPKKLLLALFSGNVLQDTFVGAVIGSLLSGNPINSYVTGAILLDLDVSFFGVTAMLLTWVTVWLVQLPVEMSVLGVRFTLIRNIAAFIVAIPATLCIVWLSGGIM